MLGVVGHKSVDKGSRRMGSKRVRQMPKGVRHVHRRTLLVCRIGRDNRMPTRASAMDTSMGELYRMGWTLVSAMGDAQS